MKRHLKLWVLCLVGIAVSAQNASVSVSCGTSHLAITVPVDLFGPGVVVGAEELILGSGCGVTAVQGNLLLLEYPLFACGATRKILPGSIHYRNILHYTPSGANGVIRASHFSHPIDCFYPRSWNVSSLGLQPTWIPFTSTVMSRQRLDFALEVYDSSWSQPVSDPTYYLGDLVNVQASVRKGNHVPLKIYVDECVARPSAESSVKYEVITNHGCLVDGQQSGSHFLATQEDGVLRFQLDTFTFIGASNNQIYLICHLKAVAVGSADRRNKACSYSRAAATWSSHEAADCSCCASLSGCGSRRRKRGQQQQQQKGLFGERDVKLGPIELKEKRANAPMVNASGASQLTPVVTSTATAKTLQAAGMHPNQVVNIIMRGGLQEDPSGLRFPFSTATLVIIVACSAIALVSILGCYCSTKRSHGGYHMEQPLRPALGELSAVAMAPAAIGTSGAGASGECSAASKKSDGLVIAASGQPTSV
nr:zona pellucida sperm-binding protein 3-like [Pogona vitticeps]